MMKTHSTAMSPWERFSMFMLDLILPASCASCGRVERHGRELCGNCFRQIVLGTALLCPVCLARLPQGAPRCHAVGFRFGAATAYDDPAVQTLITRLKFHGARKAAEPLGELLAAYVSRLDAPLEADCIVPLPLGRKRQRQRGYNQAELIARALGRLSNLPVVPILRRTRETEAQTSVASREARMQNVAGCFAAEPRNVHGQRVIIVDDVRTSGATLAEAARALREAGARSVIALAAARA